MQNDDDAEEWGSQSWLRPARAHQKSRLKRRLRAGLPAPQSSIAATKTGPTWASAADQGVRPTNRRRLQRVSGLVVPPPLTIPFGGLTIKSRALDSNRKRRLLVGVRRCVPGLCNLGIVPAETQLQRDGAALGQARNLADYMHGGVGGIVPDQPGGDGSKRQWQQVRAVEQIVATVCGAMC